MRVLWVKANKLLPVHSGGDIRSFNTLRCLSSLHQVTFLSYYDGPRDTAYEEELSRQFPGAISICAGKRVTRGLDYILRSPQSAPYAVSRFKSRAVKEKLQSWFDSRQFDVAVCDFLDAAINFPKNLTIPSVLFQHNVESEIWRRYALNEPNAAKRLIYKLEFEKMRLYERTTVNKFQHVIAVSEHDRELMSRWIDRSAITVVPTGVDLEQYQPEPAASEGNQVVVFVGAMDWEPNVDACEYFCREIWPLVLNRAPDARFRIVGRNPGRRVQNLMSGSVEVTGRVPSVVDHLRQAAAVVAPLRIGGGTRLKIYEAMAAGKAVVSTSTGAEGLDVNPGRDILIADDPATFAESVITVLRDGEIRNRYGRTAAELAAQYGWPVITRKFSHVLEIIAGVASPTPEPCVSVKVC